MNLLIYSILTWLICRLGKLRTWYQTKYLSEKSKFREDRIQTSIPEQHHLHENGLIVECCDCGMLHLHKIEPNGIYHIVPFRPTDYDYKFWRG